jgi:hypothetical protein
MGQPKKKPNKATKPKKPTKSRKAAKSPRIRVIRIKPGESLKSIYAKARRAFTADDLARCLDFDAPSIPMRQLLEELETIQRENAPKRKTKKKKRA